ncbi:hypothetical protein EYV94_02860 [Puteibacter caeruleilacunae]|nr:hypothetical protein EYV94_02860 [Puteibacter caeruleilacunae]
MLNYIRIGVLLMLMGLTVGTLIAQPTVYPYFHQVEDYPEYYLREAPPTSRLTFNNQMEIKGGGLGMDYKNPLFKGRVMRIEEGTFARENSFEKNEKLMQEAVHNGYFLRLAGFKIFRVKGLDYQNYNQLVETDDSYSSVTRKLSGLWKERYLGMQFGESDMSYVNLSHAHIFPFSRTRKGQTIDFMDHYQWYSFQTGNQVMAHLNGALWQYIGRDAATTSLGAQCFYRSSINPRVHYAFFRGMGKQYGLLWQGANSGNPNWYSDKYRAHLKDRILEAGASLEPAPNGKYNIQEPGGRDRRKYFTGEKTSGNTIGTMRNVLYTMYMWNGLFMDYEMGAMRAVYKEAPQLSPTGIMFNRFLEFQEKYGNPGVMQSPIGLLTDYYSGWRVPEVGKEGTKKGLGMHTWTTLPYEAGDYLLLNIFNVLYPGHLNTSLHRSLRYFLPDTPYGDAADVLTHDVRPEILGRYGVVVAAHELNNDTQYLKDKVTKYIENGGHFVVTAKNVAHLWAEYGVDFDCKIPGGTAVMLGHQKQLTEKNAFILYKMKHVPEQAKVVAQVDGKPLVYEMPMGKGKVTIVMSEFGLNSDELDYQWPATKEIKKYRAGGESAFIETLDKEEILTYPYMITAHYQWVLDQAFKSTQLFTVGDGLSYIVNRKGDGEYVIGIFNDSLEPKSFDIKSKIGEIEQIKEWELLDQELKNEDRFFPELMGKKPTSVHQTEKRIDDQNNSPEGILDTDNQISGSNVRIFQVRLKEERVKLLDKALPKPQPQSCFVQVDRMDKIVEVIDQWPMFVQHCSGFVVPDKVLLDTENHYLKEVTRLFDRNKIRMVVDLSAVGKEDQKALKQKLEIVKQIKEYIGNANEVKATVKGCGLKALNEERISVYRGDYNCFDDLYAEMVGKKKTQQSGSDPHDGMVTDENKKRFITIRKGIRDIENAVSKIDDFFNHFGGIVIDSRYLYNATNSHLQKDLEYIKRTKLEVIVDFSSEMQGYKGITFVPQQTYQYQWGKNYLKDVFVKMEMLGLNDAFILPARFKGSKLTKDKNVILKEGIKLCAKLAEERGVDLHWRNSGRLDYRGMQEVLADLNLKNCHPLLSTITRDGVQGNFVGDGNVDYILLGRSSEAYRNNVIFPISSNVGTMPSLDKLKQTDKVIVLDAEYISADEISKDLSLLKVIDK